MSADYDVYYDTARRFGFEISPEQPGVFMGQLYLHGRLSGCKMFVQRTTGKGAMLKIRAPLAPPLDLGLRVTRSGLIESIKDVCGAIDVQVGDARFDAAFAVRGDLSSPRNSISWLDRAAESVGDEQFDGAFRLSTDSLDKAREVLDADARVLLLGLAEGRHVHLTSTELSVPDDAQDFSPEAVPALAELLVEIVSRLSRNARLPKSEGYR